MAFRMIRITEKEQIEEFAKLAEVIWNEHFTSIIGKEQVDYMLDRFQSVHAVSDQIEKQGYHYYFIEADGKIAGYTGIHPEIENGKLFLSKLYLLKDYRKKGYASMAFDFLKQFCKDNDLNAIYLTVNKYNTDTIQVYEAKGFQTVRSQISDIGNGFVMDDYVMELEIKK